MGTVGQVGQETDLEGVVWGRRPFWGRGTCAYTQQKQLRTGGQALRPYCVKQKEEQHDRMRCYFRFSVSAVSGKEREPLGFLACLTFFTHPPGLYSALVSVHHSHRHMCARSREQCVARR